MNLAFLVPAGLAALAALALPLLIHLARRSEQRPTMFAALRWLQARPRPRTRLRFDEWPLLLVRLLLVALVALLLAHPVLSGADDRSPVVAVLPGADAGAVTGIPPKARWRWLAPGFPVWRAGEPAPSATASPSSLLRELDADLPAGVRLTVLVPPQLDGVDAERPRLSRPVDWRVVGGRQPSNERPRPTPSPRLAIRYAPEGASAMRYLRAVDAAWSGNREPTSADIAPVSAPVDTKTRYLAWVAPGPVPTTLRKWVEAGGILLLDARAVWGTPAPMAPQWRDASGVVVEGARHGRGRVLRFTRDLAPAQLPTLLDGDFPDRLRAVLEPEPLAPARVLAAVHAPLTGAPASVPSPRDLRPWLVLAIVLLFALERVLATGRRGREAP